MLDRLRIRPLLDGWRGAPPADVEAVVDLIVAVSRLAHERGDGSPRFDLNPVSPPPTVRSRVDVLIVPRTDQEETRMPGLTDGTWRSGATRAGVLPTP